MTGSDDSDDWINFDLIQLQELNQQKTTYVSHT